MKQYTIKDRMDQHVNIQHAKVWFSLDGKEHRMSAKEFYDLYGDRQCGTIDDKIYNTNGIYTEGNEIHCFF